MPFIDPMLAAPMPEELVCQPEEYCREEKFDGHRLIVETGGPGQGDFLNPGAKTVRAWTREGLSYPLPGHLIGAFSLFPDAIFDGELLVPGMRSYGVSRLENASKLIFICFDILHVAGESTVKDLSYDDRRSLLTQIFTHKRFAGGTLITLAKSCPIRDYAEAKQACRAVWEKDGEGLILKRRASLYLPGKRPKRDWIKMKQLQPAQLTIIGYEHGKLGPHSRVKLEDADGNQTVVKTRNTVWRLRLDADPDRYIGKTMHIEFQERTPDASYRHPRWDRIEGED